MQENNIMIHFLSPKSLIGTQNVMMKNYSFQKSCEQECLLSMGCLSGEKEHSTLMITLLETWMKGHLPWGVLTCVFLHESALTSLHAWISTYNNFTNNFTCVCTNRKGSSVFDHYLC